MPFITDVESLIELVDPHSDTIWIYRLRMDSEEDANWRNIQSILNQHFPELTEKYRGIAFSANHPYWLDTRQNLKKIQEIRQIELMIEL
jgi:hypothetical protein